MTLPKLYLFEKTGSYLKKTSVSPSFNFVSDKMLLEQIFVRVGHVALWAAEQGGAVEGSGQLHLARAHLGRLDLLGAASSLLGLPRCVHVLDHGLGGGHGGHRDGALATFSVADGGDHDGLVRRGQGDGARLAVLSFDALGRELEEVVQAEGKGGGGQSRQVVGHRGAGRCYALPGGWHCGGHRLTLKFDLLLTTAGHYGAAVFAVVHALLPLDCDQFFYRDP